MRQDEGEAEEEDEEEEYSQEDEEEGYSFLEIISLLKLASLI